MSSERSPSSCHPSWSFAHISEHKPVVSYKFDLLVRWLEKIKHLPTKWWWKSVIYHSRKDKQSPKENKHKSCAHIHRTPSKFFHPTPPPKTKMEKTAKTTGKTPKNSEHPQHLIGEIHMSRCINEIQQISLTITWGHQHGTGLCLAPEKSDWDGSIHRYWDMSCWDQGNPRFFLIFRGYLVICTHIF